MDAYKDSANLQEANLQEAPSGDYLIIDTDGTTVFDRIVAGEPKHDDFKRPKLHKATKKERDAYRPYDENYVRQQTYLRCKEGVHYEAQDKEQMAVILDFQRRCTAINRGLPPRKYEDVQEFLGVCDAYWDLMNSYNEYGTKFIPDIEAFCAFAHIPRGDIMNWMNGTVKKSSALINEIKNLYTVIAMCKKQLALTGKIPSIVFATDFNNNHGYTQKQENTVVLSGRLESETSEQDLRERYARALPSNDE